MEAKFAQLTQKFANLRPFVVLNDVELMYVRNWLLELHELDYHVHVIGNPNRAMLLVNQLCSIIPNIDEVLIEDTAMIIVKLIYQQNLDVEGRTLIVALDWCLSALLYGQHCDPNRSLVSYARVLQTIEALLRCNPHAENCRGTVFSLIHQNPHIFAFCNRIDEPERTILKVPLIRAMEAIVGLRSEKPDIPIATVDSLTAFFLNSAAQYLTPDGPPPPDDYLGLEQPLFLDDQDLSHAEMLRYALAGTRHLVQVRDTLLSDNELTRRLLGVCKTYMVYELTGVAYLPPDELRPMMTAEPPAETVRSTPRGSPFVTRTTKQRKRRHISRGLDDSFRDRRADPDAGQKDAALLCMTGTFGQNPPYTNCTSFNPYLTPLPHVATKFNTEVAEADQDLRSRVAQNEGKVRLEALLLLQTIMQKIEKQMLCEYFTSFMPATTDEAVPMGVSFGHNLPTCVLKDPSPRCRLVAQYCLQVMLNECRTVLFHTDQRSNPDHGAVGPDPMTNLISQLHHCLCLAINEASHTVLTQVLKALAILVRSTCYDGLSPGLCMKVIRNVKQLVDYPDTNIQVGALIVIGALLSHNHILEIESAFILSNVSDDAKEDEVDRFSAPLEGSCDFYACFEQQSAWEPSTSSAQVLVDPLAKSATKPWLVEQCFHNLRTADVAAPIKLESLQIMGAMCERYFEQLILPYLPSVGKTLLAAFVDHGNLDVLHHATKAMEQLGEAMNRNYQLRGCLDESVPIWQKLLDGPLLRLTASEHHVLRAGAADCLGAIGERPFALLPSNMQTVCITVLLSLAADEQNSVKTSAVRSVGILLLYPAVRSYCGFLLDATDIIIRAMKDSSSVVRVRASWGLGNLSDALVQEKCLEESFDGVPLKLDTIIDTAIEGSRDHDKIRCNAVRALGNLLQLLPEEDLERRTMLHEGIDALLQCARRANLMKARWNACYALGNVLKLPAVYCGNAPDGVRLSMRIFFALGWIITECTNIKVRINASVAVTSCTTRIGYADNYFSLWGALVNGLVTVENIVDSHEYQHRDKLVDQTCLTLGHMTSLVMPEDLEMLADLVAGGADDHLGKQVRRVYDRLLPENCAPLFAADERLFIIAQNSVSSIQQQTALDMLTHIFRSETEP